MASSRKRGQGSSRTLATAEEEEDSETFLRNLIYALSIFCTRFFLASVHVLEIYVNVGIARIL
jgi:hypothetical protein